MLLTTFYIDGILDSKSKYQAKQIFIELCLRINTIINEQYKEHDMPLIRGIVKELKQHIKEVYGKEVKISTSRHTHIKCADIRIEYYI